MTHGQFAEVNLVNILTPFVHWLKNKIEAIKI